MRESGFLMLGGSENCSLTQTDDDGNLLAVDMYAFVKFAKHSFPAGFRQVFTADLRLFIDG